MVYDDDSRYGDRFKQDTVLHAVKCFMALVCVIAATITIGIVCLVGAGVWWLVSMLLGM